MKTTIRKKISFLGGQTREGFINNLISLLQKYQTTVVEVYLFGSFVTDEFAADSDLDIIIIANTKTNFIKRPLDYPELFDLNISMDILVYTPEEFQMIRDEKSPIGFWKSVLKDAKKII